MNIPEAFSVNNKVAVVTGGGGVLCSSMCKALADGGAKVAVLDLLPDAAQAVVDEIKAAGGEAILVQVDVLDPESLKAAVQQVLDAYGRVDILINGAGGNKPAATTQRGGQSFFDIPPDAMQWVFNLNILGTILPCQAFGRVMAEQGEGVILNVSSMASFRPLTRVVAYSAAKMAVNNFTFWLSVHMAQEYAPNIRVNAIAPGFLVTNQNRFLLYDETGENLTERGQKIINHTPMARFGDPEDLLGAVIWLVTDASRFVTGSVVPIDGGYSAYGGA